MIDTIFLVMDASGVVKMTKRYPALRGDEIAVRLRVEVNQANGGYEWNGEQWRNES